MSDGEAEGLRRRGLTPVNDGCISSSSSVGVSVNALHWGPGSPVFLPVLPLFLSLSLAIHLSGFSICSVK